MENNKRHPFIPYIIFCINLFQSILKIYSSAHDNALYYSKMQLIFILIKKVTHQDRANLTVAKKDCAVGESNPGPSRGRRRLYHLTNRALYFCKFWICIGSTLRG
jgi:hypothetical protein